MSDYKTILVHVDAGRTTPARLDIAVELAGAFGAHLACLYAVKIEPVPSAAVEAREMLLEAMLGTGRKTLARIERRVRSAGVRPEILLVENVGGRVADEIVWQAKRWKADLIVIGTHGRRGLQRALLGSDAELVARYSPVPVLLVPARGRGKPRKDPKDQRR